MRDRPTVDEIKASALRVMSDYTTEYTLTDLHIGVNHDLRRGVLVTEIEWAMRQLIRDSEVRIARWRRRIGRPDDKELYYRRTLLERLAREATDDG